MNTINNPADTEAQAEAGRQQAQESAADSFIRPFTEIVTDLTETKYISRDFFTDNLSRIAVIVILLFLYISLRYMGSQATSRINSLKAELEDVRYEAMSRSADLVGISRPSEVKTLINRNGIDIQESDKPAYKLK